MNLRRMWATMRKEIKHIVRDPRSYVTSHLNFSRQKGTSFIANYFVPFWQPNPFLVGELPLGKFAPPSSKIEMDVRIDEVVLRALEKQPEQRFQKASEVKAREADVVAGLVEADHAPVGQHRPDPEEFRAQRAQRVEEPVAPAAAVDHRPAGRAAGHQQRLSDLARAAAGARERICRRRRARRLAGPGLQIGRAHV